MPADTRLLNQDDALLFALGCELRRLAGQSYWPKQHLLFQHQADFQTYFFVLFRAAPAYNPGVTRQWHFLIDPRDVPNRLPLWHELDLVSVDHLQNHAADTKKRKLLKSG